MAFAGFAGVPSRDVLARAVDAVIGAEVAGGASPHGAVRVTVTRGPGRRGYSPREAGPANAFVVFHPGPEPCQPHPGWRLRTSSFRVPAGDPMEAFKHGSRLLHVLARGEAEAAGADEALLLNTLGEPAECASGNILWFEDETLCHVPAGSGALAGVTQQVVLNLATARGIPWGAARPGKDFGERIKEGGALVVLSTLGVVPVLALDGHACRQRVETGALAADLLSRMRDDGPGPRQG
jgi:branched-subunit amino acid aminotransferase/4-amino-4-deoxychorismate lyase